MQKKVINFSLGILMSLGLLISPMSLNGENTREVTTLSVSAEVLPNNSSSGSSDNTESKGGKQALNANGYRDGNYIDANEVFHVEDIPSADSDTSGIGEFFVWLAESVCRIVVYVAFMGFPVLLVLYGVVDSIMIAFPLFVPFFTSTLPIQLCSNEACTMLGVTYNHSSDGKSTPQQVNPENTGFKGVLKYFKERTLTTIIVAILLFLLLSGIELRVTNAIVNAVVNFIGTRLV